MSKLTVDQVRSLLPELTELRPLMDRILATSKPDPDRRWTASGELETVGMRLVRAESVREELPRLGERVRQEAVQLYGQVAAALVALERGAPEEAATALLAAAEMEEKAWRMDRAKAWAEAAGEAALRPA